MISAGRRRINTDGGPSRVETRRTRWSARLPGGTIAQEVGVRRQMTSDWSIDLDPSYRSRVVDGDLQFVSLGPPRRTVWVSVWNPPESATPESIMEGILENVNPAPRERFREPGTDAGELRYASWYPEQTEDGEQWGLYGYTVRCGSYVQIALLGDSPMDRDWAVATWRSLRFTPDDEA
jgi:hypothetical protein